MVKMIAIFVHLKAKRMPPMSVRNNLELDHLNENLMLTELEGALIAKLIPFQKIYQLSLIHI